MNFAHIGRYDDLIKINGNDHSYNNVVEIKNYVDGFISTL